MPSTADVSWRTPSQEAIDLVGAKFLCDWTTKHTKATSARISAYDPLSICVPGSAKQETGETRVPSRKVLVS